MLKNEQARREFLRAYRTWALWLTVPELGMRMFRADLPDGSCILAAEYLKSDWQLDCMDTDVYGYPHFHLIKAGYRYSPDTYSEHLLIEHLKYVKESKGGGNDGE